MTLNNTLTEQRVLVIGGTSGFGRAVAGQALEDGADVTIIGRTRSHLDETLYLLAGAHGALLDATDTAQLFDWLATARDFDHVVSTLGGAMGGGFLDHTEQEEVDAISGKFTVGMRVARAVLPHLGNGGSLTLTAGAGGRPYNASGAVVGNQALMTLVQGLAIEVSPHKRVNAVAPYWTPTGLWRGLSQAELDVQIAAQARQIPLGRVALPEEVADAYLFLMRNRFVTGQTIFVDGGVSAL
ncbi:SDR family oxidoreductase [Lacticaseibacillus pantheris]|uniref:SDR family oxidoreductase n=1 Tax=Lacticaseibacillus pantheris TaxID=171523 RepID=UPI0026588485|nr:SDR family oxidoreductase [Lacticaseibacillus pantheris]WKF85291.1 SDR family oxidoreductase [Lacticaseibacillus pantheris]